MNYPSHPRDPSKISLGERRRNSDLARFSLELNGSNTAKNSRGGPYPSPPMSGSPLSQRRNQDFDERGQGTQDVRSTNIGQRSHISHQPDPRAAPQGHSYLPSPHQELQHPVPYTYGRPDPRSELVDPSVYNREMHLSHAHPPTTILPGPPHQQSQAPLPPRSFRPAQALDQQQEPGSQPPKAQRKTKGHVASACVPCKKAHLRCDAQRPCSRCHSNGKEDLCVDMQHKKRGRPRLREDAQQQRYEGLGNTFRPSHSIGEASMRRPLSMFTSSEPSTISSYSSDRPGPYRVLKSHAGPRGPRHLEFASPSDANMYAFQPRGSQSGPTQEPLIAYLNMELQFVKATGPFNHSVLPGAAIGARKLLDVVAVGDRDKVYRLQRELEDERRNREPNYLPPIFGHLDADRNISSTPLTLEAVNHISNSRHELITFQAPDGQQRSFDIQVGLAKKDSTYFVTFILMTPPQPHVVQDFGPPASSPFLRDSPQYGYHPGPPAGYGAPPGMSSHNSYTIGYQPGAPSMAGSTGQPMPAYSPMSQPQQAQHTPRSEVQQHIRPPPVMLPPIRSRPNEAVPGNQAMGQEWQSGERNQGRVDIGGLIDNPPHHPRRP